MRDGLDLQPSDRFWNVADPGWAYGMLYTVVGPLLLGHSTTMCEGPFTVDAAVRVIGEEGITNLAAAPTAYRMMMAAGPEAMASIAGQLRVASSAGEQLNPEFSRWAERDINCTKQEEYRQTETIFDCTARNLEYVLHDAASGAGITTKVSFETLRWTCAVRDYQRGMDMDQLREKMGLSRISWRETSDKITRLAVMQQEKRM
jgi:acetyl-CoA synthetase